MKIQYKLLILFGMAWVGVAFSSVLISMLFPLDHYAILLQCTAFVLVLGLVASLTTTFLLKKILFDRLRDFQQQLFAIISEKKFNNQIQMPGNDELTHLAFLLNSMIEKNLLKKNSPSYNKLDFLKNYARITQKKLVKEQ